MLKESNAIEGVYGNEALRDAKKAFKYMMMFDTMNSQIIKHTHKILMYNHDFFMKEKHLGQWRTVPVYIGGNKKSDPPLIIEEKIKAWCSKTMKVDKNFDPVSLHIEFEEIHPFVDGNGRIGRMLLNWHLLKRNGAPLLVYTKEDVKTYYRLFSSYRAQEMTNIMEAMKRTNWENL